MFLCESIFCSKISSGGVFIYQKISSGGNQFWGVHFYHDSYKKPLHLQIVFANIELFLHRRVL